MRLIKGVLFVVVLIFLHGCGGKPVHPPTPPLGIPLQEVCDRYHVVWQWDGVTQVVMLEFKGNKAKALVGSSTVLLGKEKITLSAPLRRDQSTIFVPEDFEGKVLAPFGVPISGFLRADTSFSRVRTVIIDPGHGGKDPGAKGISGVLEKNVALDVGKRVRDVLEAAGMKVIMTRDSDEFITLPQRTVIATRSNADLFVSIHANSHPSRRMQGLEVYYVKTQSKKDLDEDQRQRNERDFVRQLSAQSSGNVPLIVADMMYRFKVAESIRVAEKISRKMANEVKINNLGVKSCRFFVVRNTLIPAVLVEMGFLSNREEERKLNTGAYRQRLAESIARSILDYAND